MTRSILDFSKIPKLNLPSCRWVSIVLLSRYYLTHKRLANHIKGGYAHEQCSLTKVSIPLSTCFCLANGLWARYGVALRTRFSDFIIFCLFTVLWRDICRISHAIFTVALQKWMKNSHHHIHHFHPLAARFVFGACAPKAIISDGWAISISKYVEVCDLRLAP